jgi:spore coat polysaccharide biosynthesis protein SpsF
LITNFTKSNVYRSEIHQLIPGGAHTYSKGDDQFPERSPAAIARGAGSHVWDIDGNEYVDCSMGLTSISLGHAYKPVIEEVVKQLYLGANFQRPADLERKLAKEFLAQIPGHDRIKMAKNGSTVTTAAMKLARGYTGRKLVARPHNHPFYSYDDWFICTTPCDFGIPKEIAALTVTYDSMNPQSLRDLIAKYPDQIAGLITEPDSIADACKYSKEEVATAHLEIGQICKENGIVFIVDEMVSGYRSGFPGATTVYGYDADICCWGKSIGNGYSFCAMTGKAAIMDIGGIKKHFDKDGKEYPRLFLCSTTHGAEAHGLAAALAVIQTYRDNDVIGHQHRMVARLDAGIRQAVIDAGMEKNIQVMNNTWVSISIFKDSEGVFNAALRTLFLQEMIARGVLYQGIFVPCYSHTEQDIDYIIRAYKESLVVYKKALDQGDTDGLLVGEACQPVFRKWN